MRFIKGESHKEEIARFHEDEANGRAGMLPVKNSGTDKTPGLRSENGHGRAGQGRRDGLPRPQRLQL